VAFQRGRGIGPQSGRIGADPRPQPRDPRPGGLTLRPTVQPIRRCRRGEERTTVLH
jgi:hypothetical protein